MIYGIGNDIVELTRVMKACESESFVAKIYTDKERREASEHRHRLAGDFAVKEAVAKALGTGFTEFAPNDIEVLRDYRGKPYVVLLGRARDLAEREHITSIHIAISDTANFVSAVAVCETEDV